MNSLKNKYAYGETTSNQICRFKAPCQIFKFSNSFTPDRVGEKEATEAILGQFSGPFDSIHFP